MKLFAANTNGSKDLKTVWSARGRLLESVACILVLLILFVWLAEGVFRGNSQELDLRAREFVHQFSSPALTSAMQTLSFLGSFRFLLVLFLVLVVMFYLLSLRRYAAWLAAAMGGELLLEFSLKLAFHRARPEAFFGTEVSGFSFPSGHAMGSFCFYGVLAGLLYARIRQPPVRILVLMATSALVLGIGLSRIYLGVHYLTDVVAGYLAAGLWVSTLLLSARIHRSTKHLRHGRTDES